MVKQKEISKTGEPMKRSTINEYIEQAIRFFREYKVPLPEYAFWSPDEWAKHGPELDEIRDLGLGWDVTDFGLGDFLASGRIIFTLANGSVNDSRYSKPYAHKVMCLLEGQKSPIHFHRLKEEDIINWNGGNILITVWKCGTDDKLSDEPLELSISGKKTVITAGEEISLKPGESMNMPAFTYHQFWAEEGKGPVVSMEVSSICDDYNDNMFLDPGGMSRFPGINEDEPPKFLRGSELRKLGY